MVCERGAVVQVRFAPGELVTYVTSKGFVCLERNGRNRVYRGGV